MREFRIRKGLDLPLGRPRNDEAAEFRAVSQVALVGQDFPFKPHFLVAAHPDAEPAAIFVNAMDTRPGAMPLRALMQGREAELKAGLEVLAALTNSTVYFCQSPSEDWCFVSEQTYAHGAELVIARFAGPHPA